MNADPWGFGGVAVRRVRVLAVVIVFAGGAFVLGSGDSGRAPPFSNTLRVPARGASAAFLADGSPVWVVRHADASVSVLGAVAVQMWGVLGVMAEWCGPSSSFTDLYGTRFDEGGSYRSGPPNAHYAGLVAYAFESSGPHTVRVTREVGRTPQGQGNFHLRYRDSCEGPIDPAGLPVGTTWHHTSGLPLASPEDPANGDFRLFRGTLIRARDGERLCVPDKAHCDWRLKAVGVSSDVWGPGSYLGRLKPGNRVTEMIALFR